jgi:sulfite exporter TauE/SafE
MSLAPETRRSQDRFDRACERIDRFERWRAALFLGLLSSLPVAMLLSMLFDFPLGGSAWRWLLQLTPGFVLGTALALLAFALLGTVVERMMDALASAFRRR